MGNKQFKVSIKDIQLIVYDFDGVMTDNRVIVFQNGVEAIIVNRADGLGVDRFRALEIPQLIISTETNYVVKARTIKLDLEIIASCKDKKNTLRNYCKRKGYNLQKIIYVGNDLNDLDSMQDTLKMALDINAEWANLYTTMAHPGPKFYAEAIEKGVSLPETWEQYSQYAYKFLPSATKHLSPGEVLSFRDYAFQAYFENPRYLDKISNHFGIEAVRHIRKMTSHRLKRRWVQFCPVYN